MCINQISKEVVDERFRSKAVKHDMLGSFIRHGLTREQAEIELSVIP